MDNWEKGDPLPQPSWNPFYSEDGKDTNKSVISVRFWRGLNEIVVGTIAVLTFFVLVLTDASIMPHNAQGVVSPLIWIPNEVLRLSGIVFLVILEYKAFEKFLRKKFPLAFY
jgi:uncharacterized protein YjeT (DUF2065 family)